MKFRYNTNCVNCPGPHAGEAINAMQDAATEITRRTFLKHVDATDRVQVEQDLGYAKHPKQGLTMAADWHPSYYKSIFRGQECYYFAHSRIEYIFTKN